MMSVLAIPEDSVPAMVPALVSPVKHRFSVEEYDALWKAGALPEGLRTELIEGEIYEMTPIGDEHAWVGDDLNMLILAQLDRSRYRLRVQAPARFSGSMPEPDFTIYRGTSVKRRHPRSEDILLVIELSDTSRAFDRSIKLAMYAAVGIQEYWIVDLVAKRLECYTDPIADQRTYGTKCTLDATQVATPRFVEGVVVELSKIF